MPETTVAPAYQTEEKTTPETEAQSENSTETAGDTNNVEKTNEDDKTTEKSPEVKEDPPKEMRAVVLTGFIGSKSVKVLKKPEPALNAGEVLIRVKACGLNFQDLMARQGALISPPKTPFIMGFECAGVVEQLGEGVEDLKVGDNVLALPEFRAWAELVAVPRNLVYVLPEGMTHVQAVSVAMNFLVAYCLVYDLAHVSPGQSVLLHSAGGAVGQAVAQLVKDIGDVTVYGVCSKNKHEALKEGGLIDHLLDRSGDYPGEVRKLSPEGVDIVLDSLCGEECNRGYALLKPMGKYVLFGASYAVQSIFSAVRSWWQVDKVSPTKLFVENKSLIGFNLHHLMFQQGGTAYVSKSMEKVFKLWEQGKIKPTVDSTWALEDIGEAMQKMHERKNIGKIILDPSMEPKPKPATPVKSKGKEKVKQAASEDKKDDVKAEGEKADKEKTEAAENGVEQKDEEKEPEKVMNGGGEGDAESKEVSS